MKLWSQILLLLASLVLQASVVPYLEIKWFRPDLPLILLTYFSLRRNSFAIIPIAFITGLVADGLSTGYLGLSSLSYCIACFTVSRIFNTDVRPPLIQWVIALGLGSAIYAFIFAFFYSLNSPPTLINLLLKQAFPMAVYTWILGVVWGLSPFYEFRGRVKV